MDRSIWSRLAMFALVGGATLSASLTGVAEIAQSDKQPPAAKKRVKSNPKTAREPKWLPVRDLRADSFSIEYEFSSESREGGKQPVEGSRKATVVCLRGIFPQQEQTDEIVAAIPTLTPRVPEDERFPALGLPYVCDFRIERQDQDALVKKPDWDKSRWVKVSTESLLARLLEAVDFDEEIVDLAETNSVFTCPLPKLVKGRWDARVTHPRLSENNLRDKKGNDGQPRRPQAATAAVRYALFRFFDFDVERNRAYRYRVKFISENPGYGDETLPREIANGEYRESPWSEPSPPLTVGTEAK